MGRRVMAVLVVLAVLSPGLAHAGEPVAVPLVPARPAPEPAPARSSGYWTLALDGAGLSLVALSLATESEGLAILGAGVYFLGTPLVHAGRADGQVTRSLLLRLGLPALGALAGAGLGSLASCDERDDVCPIGERFLFGSIGLGVGAISASVIDATLLDRPRPRPARTWTPTVAPSSGGGVTFGVAGAW